MATPGKNASAQTVRPANSQTHHTFHFSRYGNESRFEASGLSPTISSFLGSHFTTGLALGERAQRLSPCTLVQRYARGTVRGGGEGRAQGGVILKETGSKRVIDAAVRRPGTAHAAAARHASLADRRVTARPNADQRQMTTAVEAVDFEDDRVPRITCPSTNTGAEG